ncbi:hypothetical protein JO41_02935 [Treponema sp. OMZ 838]|nr:hypothetical protein JO41_02935 [Treponema sp. OMZ 838]
MNLARMPLVPLRSEFVYKLVAQNEHPCSFWARMSVVPLRSDVFASQKLASRSVHGCTLLDRLFQKAYGEYVFKSGSGVCIYFVLHKKDRYGI